MKGKKNYLIEEEYGYSLYMKKYNQNLINKYYCKGFGDFEILPHGEKTLRRT